MLLAFFFNVSGHPCPETCINDSSEQVVFLLSISTFNLRLYLIGGFLSIVLTFLWIKEPVMGWSEFVPQAPAGEWSIDCFRLPGWGPDPNGRVAGSTKIWSPVLRIESRDFALVSSYRANRQLTNQPAPYWPITSFLWFRSGEAEIPHSMGASFREEGEQDVQNNAVYPQGPYYVHRISESKVAVKMLGRVGKNDRSGLPSFWNWSKLDLTWHYLLDVKTGTSVIQLKARNATGKRLTDVDLRLSFFLGPEFGIFHARQSLEDNWAPINEAKGSFKACAAMAEGLRSGLAVTADGDATVTLAPDSKGWNKNLSVHLYKDSMEPEEEIYGRLLVTALTDEQASNLAPVSVPSDDLTNLPYVIEPAPIRFVGGKNTVSAPDFSLDNWLTNLKEQKVRGVTQANSKDESFLKRCLDSYSEQHQNSFLTGRSGLYPSNDAMVYAREKGFSRIWTEGEAAKFKDLPPKAQPDGCGADVDATLWAHQQDPSYFRERFGYDITKADRAALVRCNSWRFAEYWREFRENDLKSLPDIITWFYGQLSYQDGRYPLNTDAMCRVHAEELAKVSNLHLVFFYYGLDNGHIDNQLKIAKAAGMPKVYFMPMSYFCPQPGDITDNVMAAKTGGADGVFYYTADWGTDWQLKEWGLASRVCFPTEELPAFLLAWDLRALVTAMQVSSEIKLDLPKDLSPKCLRIVDALRLLLGSRAKWEADSNRPPMTISIGMPIQLPGEVRDKAESVLQKCAASGLTADKGYVMPFSNTVWVGGSTSQSLENACTLMLEIAYLASLGTESVPFVLQEMDGVPYGTDTD